MDEQDKAAIRETLAIWYGPISEQWDINERYVPPPINFGSPLSQLATSAVKTYIQVLRSNAEVYKACASRVLVLYKSPIAIAAMGA